MELDHFRPQSLYPKLAHSPHNLVLSCPMCNRTKADDWPAYGKLGNNSVDGKYGYIDPFQDDRSQYFQVKSDGSLFPIKDPAAYMIHFLALNRPLSKNIRKKRMLIIQYLEELYTYFDSEIIKVENDLKVSTISPQAKNEQLQKLATLKTVRLTVEGLDKLLELD